jgi:hypothetical protein
MSFKPLKEDHQLVGALDSLSRISERCALAVEAINRWNRSNREPNRKLGQEAESLNRERRDIKQQILALVNERMSAAYNAGVEDGVSQNERR